MTIEVVRFFSRTVILSFLVNLSKYETYILIYLSFYTLDYFQIIFNDVNGSEQMLTMIAFTRNRGAVRNCAGLYEISFLGWLRSAVRLLALGMLLAVASCTGSDESHAPRRVPQPSESPSATPTQTPRPMPRIVHFVPNSHE